MLIADRISDGLYNSDSDSLEDISLLSQGRLKAGGKVFDLGAHPGVVAMAMAKMVGPTGRIIAVEGMAHNCEVAQENLRLKQIDNVHVRHALVSDKPGTVAFFDGLNGSFARDGVGGQVEAVTIDDLANEHEMPDLVFIDVEGYELHALSGAGNVFENRCDWFAEVHVVCGLEEYGGSFDQVLSFFPTSRFKRCVWRLNADANPELIEENPEAINGRFALVALLKWK